MGKTNRVADHVEHILKNTINIVVDADRKLIGRNNMRDDENVLLVVSPKVAKEMLEHGDAMTDVLLICMFAPDDTALVVKQEDWARMIDNGEIFERKGNCDG